MMTGRLCFDMAARKKCRAHMARTGAAGRVGCEMGFSANRLSTSPSACLF